jgi:hypothetical protein
MDAEDAGQVVLELKEARAKHLVARDLRDLTVECLREIANRLERAVVEPLTVHQNGSKIILTGSKLGPTELPYEVPDTKKIISIAKDVYDSYKELDALEVKLQRLLR